MFRSIQGKLVVVYLLLIVVAMELASLYLMRELERSYIGKVQDDLHQSAQLLAGQLTNFFAGDRLDPEAVDQYMERWPGEVLVLDANGVVIGATARLSNREELLGLKFSHDDVSPAFFGNTNRRIGKEGSQRMAYEAVPITVADNVVGVIYLKDSLEEAYARLQDLRDILLVATLVAMASTVVLGVALARTITGPIRELTRTAALIAGGNFDQKIPVRSGDEIGQLAEMFNRMSRQLKETMSEIQDEKSQAEAILTHMADGLMALNRARRIIRLNPAAQRMFQIQELQALGRRPGELAEGSGLEEALEEAWDRNSALTRQIRLKDRVLQAYITPLTGEGRHSGGTVVVFHDITELERLESMRREFVANVSHELKTPLTTVKSYVETLLDGAADDPEVRDRFLRVVDGETERMARLVRDLLRLTQMDEGTLRWNVRPQDVGELVAETVGRLRVQADRKRLTVLCEVDPETPPALCDYDKIQQVVINLLANAIEFTPNGGQIRVSVAPEGADAVRVTIADTGIGIPAQDLPRIFERFYRVDKARSRSMGGTGLGLSIAKQIVELSGGAIAIASEVDRGTTVTFTLPAARTAEVRPS
ncbi:sensor histidine kinase [Symbiobacterium thermophilum]|uniref:histidine kinase n=1 Tax=Symbiobacterium thermophilum TaxID=2734 RepID=A0A953IAT4_SYMTR|nr:ATP-binding protein [Symbiobacterium thermophilum]MBY6276791.1 HAMP domain-containing histidine kinase [Symbiobacterium thermophilum]